MVKGIVIHPSGEYDHVELHELADYQDAVGGYFEILPLSLPDPNEEERALPHTMYVNDSFQLGAVNVEDANKTASALAYVAGRYHFVLGPALVTGPPSKEGDDTDANTGAVIRWISRIKRLN